MESLITDNFLPVRIHVKDPGAAATMERFGANWTPAILILDPGGVEQHRIEGFLPVDDFVGQLLIGLGHVARAQQEWDRAERWFQEALERAPNTDAGPEALYWKGVARYKGTNDASALAETARAFRDRYTDSTWAKKASVWNR